MGRWLLLWFWAALAQAQELLPGALAERLQARQLPPEEISLWIQALDEPLPRANWRSDEARNPASVAKLLTTAAGLIALGGDFRWHTDFYSDGRIDARGVLQGNLYVRGGGDPFLVEERLLEALQALRQRGIQHIRGHLIMDDGHFQLAPAEQQILDGAHTAEYNAIPHPLMVNFRTIELTASPGSASLRPNITSWRIVNQIKAGKQACQAKHVRIQTQLKRLEHGHAELLLTGQMPSRCPPQKLRLVLGEGNELFFYWFRDLWRQLGGSIQGEARRGTVPAGLKPLYRHPSIPLREAIAAMNQHSNNVMTRHLLLSLAPTPQKNLNAGRQSALRQLQQLGLNIQGLHLDNGAGLSRQARVSARQLAVLLQKMVRQKDFVQSLAVSGKSGTLKKRFLNQPLHGRIWGKTGTLRDVRAFAGYQQSASGRWFLVVMLANGKHTAAARAFQDDVFQWVHQL